MEGIKVVGKEFYCDICKKLSECRWKHRSGIWFIVRLSHPSIKKDVNIVLGKGETQDPFPFDIQPGELLEVTDYNTKIYKYGRISTRGWYRQTSIFIWDGEERDEVPLDNDEYTELCSLLVKNSSKILVLLYKNNLLRVDEKFPPLLEGGRFGLFKWLSGKMIDIDHKIILDYQTESSLMRVRHPQHEQLWFLDTKTEKAKHIFRNVYKIRNKYYSIEKEQLLLFDFDTGKILKKYLTPPGEVRTISNEFIKHNSKMQPLDVLRLVVNKTMSGLLFSDECLPKRYGLEPYENDEYELLEGQLEESTGKIMAPILIKDKDGLVYKSQKEMYVYKFF